MVVVVVVVFGRNGKGMGVKQYKKTHKLSNIILIQFK